jgi:enamine deaminase RidA (YjgF/YER057c/UK114 family)
VAHGHLARDIDRPGGGRCRGWLPANVVKLNIYVVSYRPEHARVVTAALREVFPTERLPASTWLGVQSLALAELLIEIDAIAVTPSS